MLGLGLTTCCRTGGLDTGRVAGRGRGFGFRIGVPLGGGLRLITGPRRTGFLIVARLRTARRTGVRGERDTVRLIEPRLTRAGRERDFARTRGAARLFMPPLRFLYATSCGARQGFSLV